jgi:hypothetical protein
MHTTRRGRPRAACVLVVLALAGMAMPSHATAVESVSDEAGLRAAVNDSSVSEVVVTADVNITAGHLTVPPGRNLTLRGACGVDNASPCTLDAKHLSRHLHVMPGADVRVSNLRLLNGAAVNQACDSFQLFYDEGPGKDYATKPAVYEKCLGRTVQVDPFKLTLKPIGTNPLTLKYDELLSNVAFKFNLRRFTWATAAPRPAPPPTGATASTPGSRQGLTLVHFSAQLILTLPLSAQLKLTLSPI